MIWTTRPRSEAGDLAAIIGGRGTSIVLIHGVGLRAEAWNAQIDALSAAFGVMAIDVPGHGESPGLPERAGLTEYTDVMAHALTGPAVVMGHSFGAMIALDMAIRFPQKVAAVVAMNAVYRRDTKARAAVQARADSLDGLTVTDPTMTLERWFGTDLSTEREACRNWLCSCDPAGYRAAYRVFAHEDGPTEEGLKRLHCPALFLTGGLEPNSTPDMSRAMADLAPHGVAEIVPDAAHMLPMTHATRVNAILAEFAESAFR